MASQPGMQGAITVGSVIARQTVEERGIIAHEHHASRAYLEERGVEVLDIRQRLVVPGDPTRFKGKWKRRDGVRWPLHAVRLEGGQSMVFGTAVSEKRLRELFGRRLLF